MEKIIKTQEKRHKLNTDVSLHQLTLTPEKEQKKNGQVKPTPSSLLASEAELPSLPHVGISICPMAQCSETWSRKEW